MKSLMNRPMLAIALLAISTASFAASASFVKKDTAKNGKSTYTYKYFCSNGTQGLITVVSDNDDAAKKLAEQKAKVACEE